MSCLNCIQLNYDLSASCLTIDFSYIGLPFLFKLTLIYSHLHITLIGSTSISNFLPLMEPATHLFHFSFYYALLPHNYMQYCPHTKDKSLGYLGYGADLVLTGPSRQWEILQLVCHAFVLLLFVYLFLFLLKL